LHKFHKERRRSPRGCFKCGDTTHFIADCPKRKKIDSSNKYNYNNRNNSIDKGEGKRKYHFEDKKKKFQKMMSRVCATLSDLDFSSDDSSSSEEDERPKRKTGDFTGLCLMSKSSQHISDSDVSDDSSPEGLSLRVDEPENALCNQDKLLGKIFHENKKLNLELESASSEIASPRSPHDDMSVKPYDSCTMIMVNCADMWLIHSHVASLLDCARLKLRELKAHSTLLDACTSCMLLRSDLEAAAVKIKDVKHKLDHSSRYTVLSPPCETCASLKGKLLHATKENTELQQEVAYLTARLEKMIEEDLSWVEESATKSTYRSGVGIERCKKKGEKSALKFILSSSYHKEEEALKPTKAHYPSNSKSSFNPKREVRKETSKMRKEAFVYMFCGRAGHLDEFCFWRKRIERRRVEYARNSYRDEFIDFPPRSYSRIPPSSYSRALSHTVSRALPQFTHVPNHHSYGFDPRENHFEPKCFGYSPRPRRGDHFPHRPSVSTGGSFTHFEPRHLDGPRFLRRGSRPTRPSGEVQRTMKTSSGRMVKCWISKIYLTNPSTEPSTLSYLV
jgi:hypothetical protein